jgi:2-desacetyl-2-hydroxyethyl bacteriochlorophyllide A dehydrogenase
MLDSPGELRIETCAQPVAGPGEAIVRVMRCGICGSDIHSYLGRHPLVVFPVTPGHEFSGVVAEVGDGVDDGIIGARVCVEPSLTCGRCPQCVSGRYNICEELKVMGFQAPGAFCDRVAVPAEKLHILPDGVSFEAGALAEPLAVGVHALDRSGAGAGGTILIIGTGVIGLMVLTAAVSEGIDVIAIESDAARAQVARSLGAIEVFSPDDKGLARMARKVQVHAVLECVGRAETADMAVRLAPRGSTVVVVGVFPGPVPVRLDLVQDGELDLTGTLMYTSADFERALLILGRGRMDAGALVTHTVSLEDLAQGYGLLVEPGKLTLKVMVDVGGDA